MRLHAVIAATIPPMLVFGCATAPPATSTAAPTGSGAGHDLVFPAAHTATLWVKGLACPY